MIDFAVVGSGVAGSIVAWKLARAGFKVVLIEAGPPVHRAQAVTAFAADSADFDKVYPRGGDQPGWNDEARFYVQKGRDPFTAVYEKLVGGTTWHWLGTCLRLLPQDFKLRSLYGVGCDWPIDYAELEPFYGEAERELGVSGGEDGSPRLTPYPMPPLPATYLDRQVAEAARQRGYLVQVLPAARNSVGYQGRPACQGHASCVPICPIGAKYDASVHVSKALSAGVELLSETSVLRLEAEAGRITALHCIDRHGNPLRLEARHFVLAANAVETPRLLLHSELGNGVTGRFLMGMAGQISQALAPRPVWPFRSPQVVSGLLQFRDGQFRRHRAGFLTTIGNDGWPQGDPPRIALQFIEAGLFGAKLSEAVRDHVSRQLLLVSNCEEPGRPENRVGLADQLDSRGMPRPQIHFQVGSYTLKSIDEAVLIHQRIFEAMGASKIHHIEESLDPAHAAGTCRMGDSPHDSVVDRDLRSHDYSNLSIVGSAVFPSVGCAPPTLTVAALALRCAVHLGLPRGG